MSKRPYWNPFGQADDPQPVADAPYSCPRFPPTSPLKKGQRSSNAFAAVPPVAPPSSSGWSYKPPAIAPPASTIGSPVLKGQSMTAGDQQATTDDMKCDYERVPDCTRSLGEMKNMIGYLMVKKRTGKYPEVVVGNMARVLKKSTYLAESDSEATALDYLVEIDGEDEKYCLRYKSKAVVPWNDDGKEFIAMVAAVIERNADTDKSFTTDGRFSADKASPTITDLFYTNLKKLAADDIFIKSFKKNLVAADEHSSFGTEILDAIEEKMDKDKTESVDDLGTPNVMQMKTNLYHSEAHLHSAKAHEHNAIALRAAIEYIVSPTKRQMGDSSEMDDDIKKAARPHKKRKF